MNDDLLTIFNRNFDLAGLTQRVDAECVAFFAFPCEQCGARLISRNTAGEEPATVCPRCGARYEVLIQAAYQRIAEPPRAGEGGGE